MAWVLAHNQSSAPSFGVEVFPAGIHEAGDIVGTIEAFAREADGGLIVLPSPSATMHRDLIVALAARHRRRSTLSATTDGGLISYGPNTVDLYRRAATSIAS
jgi:putative tryptophan/tyrosine transport system substrate-binding protein